MQAGRIKVKGKSGRHHRQWLSGRNRVGRFGRRRPAAVGGMREFMFWAGPPVAPPRPLTRRGELCQRRLNVCRPFWADPPTWNPLAGAQCIFYPSRRGRGRRRRQQQRFSSNQTHARKHSERERERVAVGQEGGVMTFGRSPPTWWRAAERLTREGSPARGIPGRNRRSRSPVSGAVNLRVRPGNSLSLS